MTSNTASRGGRRRLALAIAGLLLVATACGSSSSRTSARDGSTTTTTTASTTTTEVPTTTEPKPPYQHLFPFQTDREAADWQAALATGGSRTWLDPGETALAFARFLGYQDVDKVVSVRNDAEGAHVSVGYVADGQRLATAAIVHLVRFGSGDQAPWEVVGTDDTSFTLATPAYGAHISSPVTVGGRITGVDESIKVHVQQLHANGVLGERCCVPAGGEHTPWSASVTFSTPTDPIVIISASTGGHLQAVERFAVTAALVP